MRLGDAVQITIGTTNLEQTLPFYEKIGYKIILTDDDPVPWAQITDGTNRILLNQDQMTYRGLTYFAGDMQQRVEKMERMGLQFIDKQAQFGNFQAVFTGPDNLPVSLIGHTAPQLPPEALDVDFRGGTFGEFTVPVADLETAITFWSRLGFDITHQSSQPHPWAILSDGLIILGLHQSADIQEPALAYFAPDMAKRLAKFREEGFAFTFEMHDESGRVNHAGLQSPDGHHIFLFEGEI